MKYLFVFALALLAICTGHAANPSYDAFIGTNGIVVRTNPPNGRIIIDGAAIVAGAGGLSTLNENPTADQVILMTTNAVGGINGPSIYQQLNGLDIVLPWAGPAMSGVLHSNAYNSFWTTNQGSLVISNDSPFVLLNSYDAASGGTPGLILNRHRGTASVPDPVQGGDRLGAVTFRGYGLSAEYLAAEVETRALDTFTDSGSPGVLTVLMGKLGSSLTKNRVLSMTAYAISNNATAYFQSNAVYMPGAGTAGQVLTSTDTAGTIGWAAPGGGLEFSAPLLAVAKTRLVFEGDSLTWTNAPSWPFWLTNSFFTNTLFSWGTNAAATGETTTQIFSEYTNEVQVFKPSGGTNAILFLWAGVNDVLRATNTVAQMYANLSNEWFLARSDGFKVCAFTVTDPGYSYGANDGLRSALNEAILNSTNQWDWCVDLSAMFPNNDATVTSDGLHFTGQANYRIAQAVATVIMGGAQPTAVTVQSRFNAARQINNVNLQTTSDAMTFASTHTNTFSTSLFIGPGAGASSPTLSSTIAIGYYAGGFVTNGDDSVFIGRQAGNLANGNDQVAIGYRAGYNSPGALRATFVGKDAGYNSTNSAYATMIGHNAGGDSAYSLYTTYVGALAGQGSTLNTNSTFLGARSGDHATNTQESILVGLGAGGTATLTNCIGIGRGALSGIATNAVFRVVQTNLSATPLIEGNFTNGVVQIQTLRATVGAGTIGHVLTSTDTAGTVGWAAAAGGGGATPVTQSNGWLRLQIQSCILPTNASPALDTGTNYLWRLLFDDTTAETAYWDFVLPDDYGTNATLVCTYSMLTGAATKTNCFVFQTQVLQPLVSNNINVDSWAASGGVTNVIPTTAGWATNFSGNLSLSAVAGDFVRLKINRDAASAIDSATGDTALHAIAIRYTKR